MPETTVRVVGGGYSTFNYQNQPIAYLESVEDLGQKPYGSPTEVIYALGDRKPREVVTQRVMGTGSIRLTIKELWNAPVWWQLQGLTGTDTIMDIWDALRAAPNYVTCTKIITPPNGAPPRIINYQNCVITDIADGDTLEIAGLSISKTVTMLYTNKLRG